MSQLSLLSPTLRKGIYIELLCSFNVSDLRTSISQVSMIPHKCCPQQLLIIDFSFLLCMWMCIYVCRGCACVNIYDLYICGICVYTYIWRSEVGIKKHWTSALIIEAGLLSQTQTSQLMATVCIQLTLKSSFLHYGKPCLYVISLWVLVPDLPVLCFV